MARNFTKVGTPRKETMSKDNVIYTPDDEAIGFYKDLYKLFVEQITDLLNDERIEEAQTEVENLSDLYDLRDYDGLILVSDNNGMGFTATKYKGEQ